MATKKQLEDIIDLKDKDIERLVNEITSLKDKCEDLEYKNDLLKSELEANHYHSYKESEQGRIINRMIEDFIREKLSVSVDCDWGGTIDVNLNIDKKPISTDSGYVITRNNPLDE